MNNLFYKQLGFFLSFMLIANMIVAQTDSLFFPASWKGIWKGNLEIFSNAGKQQELPMELHILPIDSSENYTFWIIYGEDKEAGKRPYELVTVDAEKGLYAIDEKNSIQMEAYFLGDKLIQRFEVMGNMLMTTTEKKGEIMEWEIISGSLTPVSTTGKEKVDGEEIPEVKAFPIKVVQKAILKRQIELKTQYFGKKE